MGTEKEQLVIGRPFLGTLPEASGRDKERIKAKLQRIEIKNRKSK